MYESHFGIERSPFQLTPDPWFYFDSRGHHQALSALRQGCGEGRAFVVVSGEIGSGKTMVVRSRLDEFDGSVKVGYIANTQLTVDELRQAVAAAFSLAQAESSVAVWETDFTDFLGSLQVDGRRAVLIIDEAQHLDRDCMVLLECLVQCATLFCTYSAEAASAAFARVTLARMSDARAVQMNGLGSML